MKKHDGVKRSFKWLILACAFVVLAGAVTAVLFLFVFNPDQQAAVNDKLYWNVEGADYRDPLKPRLTDVDGRYYVTFSCEGVQERLPVIDLETAKKIDMLEVMGLQFDKDGVITDCYRVEDMGGKLLTNRYYVTQIEGSKVVCNSSMTLNGYDVTFDVTENTKVWDVGTEGITCGLPGVVALNDQVIAVQNAQGNVSDIFKISYKEPGDIYWNVERKYDSTSKRTTRDMDESGGYTFLLAHNGEQVTVRTRDYEICQQMDAMAAKCFGLTFDENGYVIEVIHAGTTAGGGSCASWHRVESVTNGRIVTFKVGTATTFSGVLSENVQIFDVSGLGSYVGEPTELRVYDEVHCLRDSMGRVCTVFVVNRMVESEMYWNVERKWDATNQLTTRTPDKDGWYRIKVAVGGEQIIVKTQDPAHAQAIDERAAKCFGLELDGDVILRVYQPNSFTGGTFASWYDVTAYENGAVTCVKAGKNDTRVGMLTSDCQIYNVSSSAKVVGEKTELQVGDRIHALKTLKGEVCIIYVVNRYNEYPVYYNLDRKWDATRKCTTRTPDADGYYVFEMAYNGKLVTVKTKSKSVANAIDEQAAKCVALQISGGVATKAIHAKETVAYKGGPTSSYANVTKITDTGFNTDKIEKGVLTKQYEETFAPDCKIYNVSDNVINNRGEKTTLQVGDLIHCLKNGDGQVALIYVLTRYEDLGVYYNLDRKWDDNAQSTTRTPDADGVYTFRMAHNGKEVTVKTKSKDVANAIDSQVAKVLGIKFDKAGFATKAVHAKSTTTCKGGIGSSYANITKISGNKIAVIKDGKTSTFTLSAKANIYNVSDNFSSNQGEKTTLQVGDLIHCLKGADGNTNLVYVLTRYEDLGIYYNLDRKWDDATASTTRTPDADGYYTFRMAHNGKEVTVKTKSKDVANAIDAQVAKVLGIKFDANGLAIKALHAKSTTICKGGIGVSYAKITKIDGNKITTVKSGKETTFTLSENAYIYDVSKEYAVNQGEKTTLRVGDEIHCLKAADGTTNFVYTITRGVLVVKAEHTCQHETDNVQWYAWDGSSAFHDGNYYVLTADATLKSTVTVPAGREITLCLNGHTLSADTRIFKVYGKLNICDHKDADGNYHGKLTSSYSSTVDENGKVTAKAYAGIAYLYNASASSELNIYGGILEHTGSTESAGIVYIANTGDEKYTAVVNLYDGVLTGGNAVNGGAIFISNNGKFVMHGGLITDCTANKGGAIAMSAPKGVLAMQGGKIESCSVATTGGAIQIDNGKMQMTGGLITGNTATGNGGAISLDGGKLLMQGGTLDGNIAKEGGNLRIGKLAEVVLASNAKLTNGQATNGGNITMFGKLAVMDGAKIVDGQATSEGSAISVYSNFDDSQVAVNVHGGTIEGSIRFSSKKGASVEMYLLGGSVDTVRTVNVANATVVPQIYVGGSAKVKDIYLAAGRTVQIAAPFEDTAFIGISMADMTQHFASVTDAEQAKAFYAVDSENYKVANTDNKLYLVSALEPHVHCLCNGKAEGVSDHTCDTNIAWQPWTNDKALPTESGYYYLTTDVTLSDQFEMKGKLDLHICLNDHTITGPGGGKRAFLLRDADLTITDCGTKGTITNEATETLNGGLIYQYSGSSCNDYNNSVSLYGGTLTVTGAAKSGGVVYLGNNYNKEFFATFNMYGGKIIGCQTVDHAGCMQVTYKGVLNLYAGEITGGTAGKNGGNLYLAAGTQLNLLGGSVTGGSAAGKGNDIYAMDSVVIGGKPQVGELLLAAGKTLVLSQTLALEKETAVGIVMENPGAFLTVADKTFVDCFPSVDDGYKTVYRNGGLALRDVNLADEHTHCLCNGNAEGLGDHTCDEEIVWQPWSNDKALPTESGYYYLTTNVTLSAQFEMKGKLDLHICLNDHTITGPGGGKRAFLLRDADLTIADCGTKGAITNEATESLSGGLIYQYSGSSCNNYNNSVNLYGGTLTVTGKAKSAGVVFLGNNTSKDYFATFNMYGGKIIGCEVADYAGSIQVSNKCLLNIYGGEITGGTAGKNGGNINVSDNSRLNLLGGSVTGGMVAGNANDINTNHSIVIGGNVQVGVLYLAAGKSMAVSQEVALDNASLGVKLASAGVFATGVTESTLADCFTSVDGWQTQYNAENQTLSFVQ